MRSLPVCLRGLLVCSALVLLVNCASSAEYKNGVYRSEEATFRIPPLKAPWQRLDVEDAELAFHNPRTEANISLNATCEEYEDAPPEALGLHLLIGIVNRTVHTWEAREMDGRKALFMDVSGELDGAPVRLAAYVLAKDYCAFDLIYTADPKHFDKGLPTLHKLAESFHMIQRGE